MATTDAVSVLEALGVTAEVTGTELSKGAARVMAGDLSVYPVAQVLGALTRCRRELKGRLTVAAIVERLEDGRPGPNEAWAMIPQDERGSVVWTEEMAEAYGVAGPLLREGQIIAGRSAFIETYAAAVTRARTDRRPTRWNASLGHDVGLRATALQDAARRGRITAEHAQSLLPGPDRASADGAIAALAGPRSPIPPAVKAQLLALTGKTS